MKAKSRAFLGTLKKICTNLYVLFFLNGFLLCLIVYTYFEDQYECETFGSLAAYVLKPAKGKILSADTALIRSLHLTYKLETIHRKVFSEAEVGGFIARDLRPVSYDFTTGSGACGSSTLVLGRLLLSMNYQTRFAHMLVDGVYGGHNVLEVKLHDRWIVFDPLYDLYFVRPDGQMAGFEDVRNNWAYYRSQTPPGYNMHYSYSAVTYTNWNRIPVLTPGIKSIINFVIGRKRADAISLRTLFLRKFHFLLLTFLLLSVAVALYTLRQLLLRREKTTAVLVKYDRLRNALMQDQQLMA